MTRMVQTSPFISDLFANERRTFSNNKINMLRSYAMDWLVSHGLPPRNAEKWRFFDTRPIERGAFSLADPASTVSHEALLDSIRLEEASKTTIVVLNGVFQPQLSSIDTDGVSIGSLSELSELEQNNLLDASNEFLTHCFGDDAFVHANLASLEDFTLLTVKDEVSVESPIHVIYIVDDTLKTNTDSSSSTHPMTHPHLLVLLGKYAKVTLVEEWVTAAKSPFVNSVTQIELKEGANLNHIRLQRSQMDALHVDRVAVSVESHSRYDACSYTVGALKARTDIHLVMAAQDGWARIDGVAVLDGKQEADTHSVIENASPLVTSHQLHKLVVAGESHGVFNGCIWVQPGSQQIKSYQLNRNLLLSDKSRVDVKPQLEIFADDVECSHGSATGQLDEEQLFYLETRGIPYPQARATLTFAFAAEVLENIEVSSLKDRLVDETYKRIQRTN